MAQKMLPQFMEDILRLPISEVTFLQFFLWSSKTFHCLSIMFVTFSVLVKNSKNSIILQSDFLFLQ